MTKDIDRYLVTIFTKSYLWSGRTTNDTDRYLVMNLTMSYLQDGYTMKDTNEYLVTKFFHFYLWDGRMTKGIDVYLIVIFIFILFFYYCPTYKVDKRPRGPTSTWSQEFFTKSYLQSRLRTDDPDG